MPNAAVQRLGREVDAIEDALNSARTEKAVLRLVARAGDVLRRTRSLIASLEKDRRGLKDDDFTDESDFDDAQDEIDDDIDDAVAIKDDLNELTLSMKERLREIKRRNK